MPVIILFSLYKNWFLVKVQHLDLSQVFLQSFMKRRRLWSFLSSSPLTISLISFLSTFTHFPPHMPSSSTIVIKNPKVRISITVLPVHRSRTRRCLSCLWLSTACPFYRDA